jgi:membrane-associated phospholipid phosphatase
MTRSLKIWLVCFLVTVAFVWVSFHWVDKPIALGIYNLFGGRRVSTELADRIVAIPLISAVIFILCGLFAVSGRRFSKLGAVIALCDISVLATIIIKDQLKFAFGRTWPDTWGPGIVSFVRDGVYGFHFFQFGKSFESFPSGHAAVAAAVLTIAGIMYPGLRVVCAIGVLLADAGLVVLNLHFLGDAVAGSFVGFSAGLFTVMMWRVGSNIKAPSVASAEVCSPN